MSSNVSDAPLQNLKVEQESLLLQRGQLEPTRKRNKRSWVSINLMSTLVGMVITGLMSYFFSYSEATAGIHTWFGIYFILLMVFHLRNNIKPFITHICKEKGKRLVGISVGVCLVLTLGVLLSLPPFSSVLELGRNLRKSIAVEEGTYQTITTRIGKIGIPIEIELRRGEHYESDPQPLFLGLTYTTVPQVAFWLEDMEGKYLGTLYVTQKISNASFVSTEDYFSTVSRPESLPYWAHQRAGGTGNGNVMPVANSNDLDGITGATPLGNYDIRSTVDTNLLQFKVMMEINRSYDFNDFYTKDKYPKDVIYSGSGSSGQPSVIYTAEVNLADSQKTYFMKAVGHGHYSGEDGALYTDMEGLDTALQLVKRVTVEI